MQDEDTELGWRLFSHYQRAEQQLFAEFDRILVSEHIAEKRMVDVINRFIGSEMSDSFMEYLESDK